MFVVLLRNLGAGLIGLGGALFWTKAVARLSRSGVIPARSARKLSHITTAPFFMMTWPFYTPHRYAAIIAAAVPLSFAMRIAVNPRHDPLATATARTATKIAAEASREGRSLAAYGASVAALTAVGWRSSVPTYIAVAALCLGDGTADVAGTACGGPALPLPPAVFSRRKTLPGTIGFVFATIGGAGGLIRLAAMAGFVPAAVPWAVICKVAAASAAVELFPMEDNVTVPFSAFFLARTLLGK